MKTQYIILSFLFILASAVTATAQKNSAKLTKETFKVWGECGMCKKTIEKAAKDSGAVTANWNTDSKQLTVTYNNTKTSNQQIQQAIAAAGYDTRDLTADNDAYDKLHECCRYDRKAAAAKAEKTEENKEHTGHH